MSWIVGLFLAFAGSDAQAYTGSTFKELVEVLSDRKVPAAPGEEERSELAVYREGRLPHYEVTGASFFNHGVSHGVNLLTRDANRTLDDKSDYFPRLKKLLHPNGVCLTGTWKITEPSPYTGYFAQGSEGLFVGRVSVTMDDTEAGNKRGFGFAAKILPTLDPTAPVRTANFFTVDVLFGTKAEHFVDVAMTNEPDTGFAFGLIPLGLKIAGALNEAEPNAGFRPLYPVAELGLAPGSVARAPHWIRLRAAPGTARISEPDFRKELNLSAHFPAGLRYEIAVSERTRDREENENWAKLGTITLNKSYVSYGCDRQLHFTHPRLKP